MDMSLREWLILIGAVILIGILLDGYRRMLRAKRDALEISRSMGGNFESTPLDDHFNPELPNGGARIIGSDGYQYDDTRVESEWHDPEWDEDEHDARHSAPFHAERDEPDFDVNGFDDDLSAAQEKAPSTQAAPENSPRFPEAVKVLDEPVQTQTQSPRAPTSPLVESRPSAEQTTQQTVAQAPEAKASMAEKAGARFSKMMSPKASQPASSAAGRKEKTDAKTKKPGAGGKQAQEIIIINVLSKEEGGFSGLHLRKLVEACGMEFGEMSVFTRHEHDFGEGPVQFGMANLVEPGTFDLKTIDDSHTPGVCFFLSLPGPDDSMKAFEYMLETAQCVVRHLNGDMKDERRSVFTQQTIEHCRQRIREFERRQQLTARV